MSYLKKRWKKEKKFILQSDKKCHFMRPNNITRIITINEAVATPIAISSREKLPRWGATSEIWLPLDHPLYFLKLPIKYQFINHHWILLMFLGILTHHLNRVDFFFSFGWWWLSFSAPVQPHSHSHRRARYPLLILSVSLAWWLRQSPF